MFGCVSSPPVRGVDSLQLVKTVVKLGQAPRLTRDATKRVPLPLTLWQGSHRVSQLHRRIKQLRIHVCVYLDVPNIGTSMVLQMRVGEQAAKAVKCHRGSGVEGAPVIVALLRYQARVLLRVTTTLELTRE